MRTLTLLPAANAARTLEATLAAQPPPYREQVLPVDDGSSDDTAGLARSRLPSSRLGKPAIVLTAR